MAGSISSKSSTNHPNKAVDLTVIKPRHRLIPKKTGTLGKIFLISMYGFLVLSTITILFGEIVFLGAVSDEANLKYCSADYERIEYENPDYHQNPCRLKRYGFLLGLTPKECDYGRRVLTSVLLGGIIGYERKSADRPAGIRTMSLVSLGSCFFTISSMRAFESSTMGWDAARVSAAIPSGVGFLGACLIWKGSQGKGPDEVPAVHGLTTAASVWLSASIGVNAGGRMYVVAFYTAALVVIVLRVGPRLYFQDDASSYFSEADEELDDMSDHSITAWDEETYASENFNDDEMLSERRKYRELSYGSIDDQAVDGNDEYLVPINDPSETRALLPRTSSKTNLLSYHG